MYRTHLRLSTALIRSFSGLGPQFIASGKYLDHNRKRLLPRRKSPKIQKIEVEFEVVERVAQPSPAGIEWDGIHKIEEIPTVEGAGENTPE
jgi:hypothetical protein